MSLFIANLAFAQASPDLAVSAVIGILVAFLTAALAGYIVLTLGLTQTSKAEKLRLGETPDHAA